MALTGQVRRATLRDSDESRQGPSNGSHGLELTSEDEFLAVIEAASVSQPLAQQQGVVTARPSLECEGGALCVYRGIVTPPPMFPRGCRTDSSSTLVETGLRAGVK
jgi:hypothetical protein